ncbi:MAG TPA: 5-carboxymethyl-2-hydroxymuconate Delta-isomerase [Steroidobacteraceae bacterium]|nr:5-carboxymethyl-2-hydroxymuconate Delta-isomerase [Steroidobacteraceae bacterium]
MAHIVIEYSAGLRERLGLPELLSAVHQAALATGVFPIGGLRTRAYEAQHYVIADGHPENAFVHLSLKVGHGRDLETRRRACETIFDAACRHLASIYESQPLAISLEMQEIDPVLTFKKNNLHEQVKRRQGRAATQA